MVLRKYSIITLLYLNPRLGGGNRIEWKWKKKIILEYSSFLYLRVLMEGMESSFPYLEV